MAATINHVQNCLEATNLKQKTKLTHPNDLIFILALHYAQMKTCMQDWCSNPASSYLYENTYAYESPEFNQQGNPMGQYPFICVCRFKALDYHQVPGASAAFSFKILLRHYKLQRSCRILIFHPWGSVVFHCLEYFHTSVKVRPPRHQWKVYQLCKDLTCFQAVSESFYCCSR